MKYPPMKQRVVLYIKTNTLLPFELPPRRRGLPLMALRATAWSLDLKSACPFTRYSYRGHLNRLVPLMAVPLFQTHGITVCPSHGRPSLSNPWDDRLSLSWPSLFFKPMGYRLSSTPTIPGFQNSNRLICKSSSSLFFYSPSLFILFLFFFIHSSSFPPYLLSISPSLFTLFPQFFFLNSFSLTFFL